MQRFPGLQSWSATHGQAHLPAATLHRWVRQFASVVHGKAIGDGVARVPAGAGAAVGAGAAAGGAAGVAGAGAGAAGAGAGVAAGAGGYA